MTADERLNTLRMLDQILRDNIGNRVTPALVVGVVNTLHDNIPVGQPLVEGKPLVEPPASAPQ